MSELRGKSTLEVGDRGATFSDCGRYRYSLWRRWADGPSVLFVMLNPSTADAEQDDPTIRRCVGFARRWGAGGLTVCNLYAWRATRPGELPSSFAVGEGGGIVNNPADNAIAEAASEAERIIAAWGANVTPHKSHRVAHVLAMLEEFGTVEVLGLTRDRHPRHPLYVRGDAEPIPFRS